MTFAAQWHVDGVTMGLWTVSAIATLWGLCVGSFINVVAYRLPRMMDVGAPCGKPSTRPLGLAWPPSHCPSCKARIRPWQNIPLVSYALLRGRCAECAARIPLSYPMVEGACAVLTVAIALHFGPTWQAMAWVGVGWVTTALAAIDARSGLLPDCLTQPLVWAALLLSASGNGISPSSAIIGSALGYGVSRLLAGAFERATGRVGLGRGDCKLAAAFGAWYGWSALPAEMLCACIAGMAVFAWLACRSRARSEPMPFGPMMVAGFWVVVLLSPAWPALNGVVLMGQ